MSKINIEKLEKMAEDIKTTLITQNDPLYSSDNIDQIMKVSNVKTPKIQTILNVDNKAQGLNTDIKAQGSKVKFVDNLNDSNTLENMENITETIVSNAKNVDLKAETVETVTLDSKAVEKSSLFGSYSSYLSNKINIPNNITIYGKYSIPKNTVFFIIFLFIIGIMIWYYTKPPNKKNKNDDEEKK
jgi:hypothetical protein